MKKIIAIIMAVMLLLAVGLIIWFARTGNSGDLDLPQGDTADTTMPSSGTDGTDPDHTHEYTAAVTAPTCTEDGYTTYTCTCGDSYISDTVAATGHDYHTVTVPSTTQDQGYDVHTCVVCGVSYEDNFVDALTEPVTDPAHAHSYTAAVTAPTCTTAGYTTYTCECGDSYTAEEVAATGHDYAGTVTEPTCTAGGYTTYVCKSCSHSYTGAQNAALGHDYRTETVPPTAEAEGYDLHTCTRCGDSYKDNYTDRSHEYTLSLGASKLTLDEGDTYTFSYTYTGPNSLTWKSSDTSVVTVNSSGKITAKAAGTATITLTDGSKNAQCKVTVNAVTHELTVTVTSKTIYVGDTYQIEYTYTGSKSDLAWTSRNTSVATVDSNGKVTGKAAGVVSIMVTDGDTTRKCTITVEEKPATTATDIKFWTQDGPLYNNINKYAGDYLSFTVYNYPEGSDTDITITSSNSSVVSVSSSSNCSLSIGRAFTLNFKNAGTATIKLTSGDGAVTKSFTITVKSGYSFDPGDGQLTPEQFANYMTKVMCANGFTQDTTLGSWRQFTLTASQLNFAKAVQYGQAKVHEWWPNGNNACNIVYVGQNEDGNYVFHECWG